MPQPKRGKNQNKKQGKKGRGRPEKSLTAPLDYQQAWRFSQKAARAEAAPTINKFKGDIRGSVERQKNIGQMFQGLGNTINQGAAATDASYGQANAALLAHMNAAQQAAAASQGQIAQSNMDMTALTGADPSLTAPSLQEGAAAANQRNIAGAALAAPIAQAGASQAAYLRNTGTNAQREGISQKLGEAKRRDTLKEGLMEARKYRGGKGIENFLNIRKDEQNYNIQRRAFPEQQADRQLQREEGEAGRAIDWYNAKTGRKNTQQGGSANVGRTPEEERDRRQGFKGAMSAGKNLIQANGVPKTPQEWAGLQALLEDKSEITPQEAAQVVKRLKEQNRKNPYEEGTGW